jgi:hypothetical protein
VIIYLQAVCRNRRQSVICQLSMRNMGGSDFCASHDFRDIDPEDLDGLCHWTRLPVVNGCPQSRNHSASSKPF